MRKLTLEEIDTRIAWFKQTNNGDMVEFLEMVRANFMARPEVGVAEQEPVAWRWRLRNHGLEGWLYGGRAPTSLAQNLNYQVEPLYGYPWRSMNKEPSK